MKLLIVGDIHLRGTNPRHRKGDFLADTLAKVREICEIAAERGAYVLQVGDIFDSPSASYKVFGELSKILWEFGRWMAIPGNHDTFGHSLETLPRTPYGALMASGLIDDQQGMHRLQYGTSLYGVGFDHTLDRDYSEYKPKYDYSDERRILVVHGMLLPEEPPFERFSLLDTVARETTANVIITGHYHLPFIKERNGKLFINPGAVTRTSATEAEISRTPQVVYLNTVTLNYEVIPLKSAKPGEEVLDRKALIEEHAREENMEAFLDSLEFSSEATLINLQEIIEKLALTDGIPQYIVDAAMIKLAQAREKRG